MEKQKRQQNQQTLKNLKYNKIQLNVSMQPMTKKALKTKAQSTEAKDNINIFENIIVKTTFLIVEKKTGQLPGTLKKGVAKIYLSNLQ
jgi:hypothetical protein